MNLHDLETFVSIAQLGGVTRAKSTVNEPLSRPIFSRMRSAVSIELWRKPVVVVTTSTFLGLAAALMRGGPAIRMTAVRRPVERNRSECFIVLLVERSSTDFAARNGIHLTG